MYNFISSFQTISRRFFDHVLYQGSCQRSSPVYKASTCWEFIIQFSAAIQPALFFRGVSKCEIPISKWAFNLLKIFFGEREREKKTHLEMSRISL